MLGAIISVALGASTIILSTISTGDLPSREVGADPVYPAAPGYLLPWAGGRIHTVTQGEETSFTHNGRAAYAFDINLNYDDVVAARSGKVTHVYVGSNSGGCTTEYAAAANYVVIDHGDGTSALYLHLAYGSSPLKPGDLVRQGEPVGISGETGLTCTGVGEDVNPAPHLHFQVQRNDGSSYMGQSVPVTFDDVKGDGIPHEGESYVSGNYGPGKPQKIKLTPRRVPRIFNPVATPADPNMFEVPEETPMPEALLPGEPRPSVEPAPGELVAGETPAPAPTEEPIPPTLGPEETPTPEDTPEPEPSATPEASATPTPTPTPTPSAEPSLAPAASPTAEPGGGGAAEASAVPPTATPTPTPSATAAP